MNISGKKMGSVKALKESLKKGGSSMQTYIKNVPAEGITVRFLTEPEEWFGYYEYWNDESRNFCPMAVGEVLPDGAKPSFRYLACVLDIETDRVVPLKLAKTAANSLILKYDKYGTMLDRNYELQKHGEKLDTTYDVTPDAPSKLNLVKYDILDLEKVLLDARANALGEKEEEPFPARSTKVVDDEDIDDDFEDEEDEASGSTTVDEDTLFPDGEYRYDYRLLELRSMSSDDIVNLLEWWEADVELTGDKAINAILQAQKDYENEDAEESELEEDEDTDSYDEDTLKAMSIRDLRLIAEDLEIEFKDLDKNSLITAIIEAVEE